MSYRPDSYSTTKNETVLRLQATSAAASGARVASELEVMWGKPLVLVLVLPALVLYWY